MKIKILTDTHHRVSSAISQGFKAGGEPNLPKSTAEALIAKGDAEAINSSDKGDHHANG